MSSAKKVWLIGGSRTPIGSYGRSLKAVTVDSLVGHVFVQAIRRCAVAPSAIDGIILGHGYQSTYTPNTARFAQLNAGLPAQIPAMTIQRQCGSGMQAVNLACNEILLGNGDLYLAGGAESMSTVPYLLPGKLRYRWIAKRLPKFGPQPVFFKMADDGLVPLKLVWDLRSLYMSGTAQRLADTYGISRQAADEYALRSQELALAAVGCGRFDCEIDAIQLAGRHFFSADEHPRKTSLESLAKLPGVLKTRDVTAGNTSGINDGACAIIVASEEKGRELGCEPLALLVDSCVVGVDPEQMGLGPVFAIRKLLGRNQLDIKDIGLFEINEAFAAQYLACEKLLELDREKVNVNGGAIALGHPIGMTGARLILTLAHELRLRSLKYGIASLCIGGGMGIATLLELP